MHHPIIQVEKQQYGTLANTQKKKGKKKGWEVEKKKLKYKVIRKGNEKHDKTIL